MSANQSVQESSYVQVGILVGVVLEQTDVERLFVDDVSTETSPDAAAPVARVRLGAAPAPAQIGDERFDGALIGRQDHGLALDAHGVYGVVIVVGTVHVAVIVPEALARTVT